MIKYFTIFLFASLLWANCLGQNAIRITNPTGFTWNSGSLGIIDVADFYIRPVGNYMQVDMFLTLSADDSAWSDWEGQEKEIVFDFNLPEGAIVNDSWLWMPDGDVIKADVIDISEGRDIYADLVFAQNVDPSLLINKKIGGYQIRIFPLLVGASRKIKISYLSPTIWKANRIECPIPLEFIHHSQAFPERVGVFALNSEQYGSAVIEGKAGLSLIPSSTDYGPAKSIELTEEDMGHNYRISYDSPMDTTGIFLSCDSLDTEGNKFYQVAYKTPDIAIESDNKNVVLIYENRTSVSSISHTVGLEFLVETFNELYDEDDKFNLSYQSLEGAKMLSPNWMEGVSDFTNTLLTSNFSFQTNNRLYRKIQEAVAFIEEEPNQNAEILIIAATDQLGPGFSFTEQPEFYELLSNHEIKVSIVNFQSKGYSWTSTNNTTEIPFYTNVVFYRDICLATGGTFSSSIDHGLTEWDAIYKGISKIKLEGEDYQHNFDLHFDQGITFNNYEIKYRNQRRARNGVISQTGQYFGSPTIWEIDYIAASSLDYIDTLTLVANETSYSADSLLREIWYGEHLEQTPQNTAEEIAAVVELSTQERVLSYETAFIALEPSQGGITCFDCGDPGNIASGLDDFSDGQSSLLTLEILPNPVRDFARIKIKTPVRSKNEKTILQITDLQGNILWKQVIDELDAGGEMEIKWNRVDANGNTVPSGIYLVQLISNEDKIVKRMMIVD